MDAFDHLRPELELADPPHPDDLHWLRQDVGAHVPEDYLAFIEQHDGASGEVGELWPAAEVGRGKDVAPGVDHLAELVLFGSDGGLEAFAFDAARQVVVVPWIGGERDAVPQGSFVDFTRRLVERRL
jgi:hypothetical protein